MAARVEFIETDSPRPDVVACRKVAELCASGERVCLLAAGRAEAAALDALLWTFDDQAFVPHSLTGDSGENGDRVALVTAAINPNGASTLVVAGEVDKEVLLLAAALFDFVIDYVPRHSPDATALARERYKALGGAGHSMGFKPLAR